MSLSRPGLINTMFKNWRTQKPEPEAPVYPPDQRIYCIGDIHGRADLLEDLHRQITTDAAGYNGQLQLLYLGDYIDRGDDSSRILDILLDQAIPGFEAIHLRGNHEQAMLDFLVDPEAMAGWLTWGGRASLRSYGINPAPLPSKTELLSLRDRLERALPANHLDFLNATIPAYRNGDYYFVHAGIRPGVKLEKQAFEDQLWIRDPFLQSKKNHGAVIVHGHSVTEEAELLPNRIGIDTGAIHSGVLTSLVLEGPTQRLLQTNPNS